MLIVKILHKVVNWQSHPCCKGPGVHRKISRRREAGPKMDIREKVIKLPSFHVPIFICLDDVPITSSRRCYIGREKRPIWVFAYVCQRGIHDESGEPMCFFPYQETFVAVVLDFPQNKVVICRGEGP